RTEQRLLEQVKHLEHSVTLNSGETRSALANFVEHRSHNPGTDLQFRFVTTASIGREQGSPLPTGVKGIEAWEKIRLGGAAGASCVRTLAGIRSILRNGSKPDDLPLETWTSYQKHLKESRGAGLLSLVLAFEWSTGRPEPDDLRAAIEQTLRERGQ